MAVYLFNDAMWVISGGEAVDDAMVLLYRGRNAKNILMSRGCCGFEFECHLERFEEGLPGVPRLIHDGFSIQSGAVPGEGAVLKQHACCKGSKHVVGDR